MPVDNRTFVRKRQLRVNLLLKLASTPIVLETHAGAGKLYRHCYLDVPFGIAIDRNPEKAAGCAKTRPSWAVYEADSERALRDGLARRWPINFVDADPWGSPWATLAAFFESERERPPRIAVAVTDGLRQAVQLGIGWNIAALRDVVARFGNAELHDRYLEVCEQMLTALAHGAGYRVESWTGYFTGHGQSMTHYGAVLVRGKEVRRDGRAQDRRRRRVRGPAAAEPERDRHPRLAELRRDGQARVQPDVRGPGPEQG